MTNVIEAVFKSDEPDSIAAENSEIALADVFASRYRDRLRYVALWGQWKIWERGVWLDCVKLEYFSMARDVVAEASEELVVDNKVQQGKALGQNKTVAGVVNLARCDPRLAAGVDQWDADHWVLNTPGGVVDLRTGDMLAHDPLLYCSKITAVAPALSVPDDCLWLQFVHRICDGRPEQVEFLKRALGYSLTGSTKEEVLFFPYGTGANGKSKFMNAAAGAVGSYHENAAMETFIASKYDHHPADLAKLRGARLVTANETEEGRRWSESKIKAITGGDPISARFMRQDFFTYKPECKLWVVGNHKPGLRNVDYAMRRRMNLIPFTVTIPEQERDRDLEEKLKAEWPIILRWMIEGCIEWQEHGLTPPGVVKAATDEYLAEEDVFGQWLAECCDVERKVEERVSDLWTSWKVWATRAEEHPGTQKKFSQTLKDRGFTSRRTNVGAVYCGLSVRVMS